MRQVIQLSLGTQKKLSVNQRSICQHCLYHGESKGVLEKTSTSASLTMLKPFNCWVTTNWKILKEMEVPWKTWCAGQEAAARTRYGTTDWFKMGEEYVKPIYWHSDYLTFM